MPTEKIQKYRSVVEENPEDELAHFTLGQALYEERLCKEAVDHFERAFELQPDWMLAALLLGKCWLDLGEVEKAKEMLGKALDLARVQHHEDPAAEIEMLLTDLDV